MSSSTVKILRIHALTKIGIARSTIYDWINPKSPRYDGTFQNSFAFGNQSVGWLESEVDQWILQREISSH
jgi:prophage regulatory protein